MTKHGRGFATLRPQPHYLKPSNYPTYLGPSKKDQEGAKPSREPNRLSVVSNGRKVTKVRAIFDPLSTPDVLRKLEGNRGCVVLIRDIRVEALCATVDLSAAEKNKLPPPNANLPFVFVHDPPLKIYWSIMGLEKKRARAPKIRMKG